MRIVETDCQAFLKQVMPAGCSPEQMRDMRMAFYAGYKSMLMMMRTVADEADEAVGCAVLDQVDKEMADYFQELKTWAAAVSKAEERAPDAGS